MKTPAFPLQLAKESIIQGHYQSAIELLTPLSITDNTDAQFLLGYLYFLNPSITQEQAIKLLISAAEQNHPAANYVLATSPNLKPDYKFIKPLDEHAWQRLNLAVEQGFYPAIADL